MNYYELTEEELDGLGAHDRDTARHFAVAAFALGLVVDLGKDFLFDPPNDGTMKGVEITLLFVAIVGAIFYFVRGFQGRRANAARLRKIKDSHDFS